MAVEMTEFFQHTVRRKKELTEVREIASKLVTHLNRPAAQEKLAAANLPGSSIALVQAAFLPFARRTGFVSESTGLFAGYPTSALRPDYFLRLGRTGILLG